ncbi:hypothetical protein AKJ16_DCAP11137, partial [Drosera capensis]
MATQYKSYIMVTCSMLYESMGAFRQFPEPLLGGSLRRTRGGKDDSVFRVRLGQVAVVILQ